MLHAQYTVCNELCGVSIFDCMLSNLAIVNLHYSIVLIVQSKLCIHGFNFRINFEIAWMSTNILWRNQMLSND